MVIVDAAGAYFTDADGQRYLDYHAAFGPIILGHNHPAVNAAVRDAMNRLDIIGAGVTDIEIELAETIARHVPSAARVLLTNSGSEATYAALRLARAVTGRNKIVKFQGTYHGWHDAVLMNVISSPEKIGHKDPLSLGMLPEVVQQTLILPFNDIEAIAETLQQRGDEIAAVIVEVIPHNIGCVLPRPEFLAALRELTRAHDVVLIFDEVITGFRHSLGGYQAISGVTPDLSTFAKAMANGYPIAALTGRAEFMDRFGPGGGVMFAGTYNGHPVGVSAALATIAALEDGSIHRHCFDLARQAAAGIQQISDELGIPMNVVVFGSVFVPYFMQGPIESYTDLLRNNNARDMWFRRTMCEHGIFMLPTALKRNHVSAAHTQSDIDRTVETARQVLRTMPATL
jgi:glutamate-1-semialdehyde 2,1-aminomutase